MVDPVTGSNNLGLGTQQLPKGSGIPVHRHLDRDEAFYVLEGSGTVTLNDVCYSCERGGTIFIPKNTWHGFSSPDQELVLLWVMVPPRPRRLPSRNLQPTRRTAKGIDAGANQLDRSQIWTRIQVGRLKHLKGPRALIPELAHRVISTRCDTWSASGA
ncbi:cupin domain-containing protein [Bradyrhizobium sp. USDA 3315]